MFTVGGLLVAIGNHGCYGNDLLKVVGAGVRFISLFVFISFVIFPFIIFSIILLLKVVGVLLRSP